MRRRQWLPAVLSALVLIFSVFPAAAEDAAAEATPETIPEATLETTFPDMDKLEDLLDALADTLYTRHLTSFDPAAEDAPAGVAYGLIWRLLYRGLLPYLPVDGVVTLTEAQLRELYEQLFAAGSFVMPEEDCCEAITRTEDGLAFDISTAASESAGMQLMLAEADNAFATQQLLLELYHVDADYYLRTEEDLLSADWYGGALAEVSRDEEALFGWKIVLWSDADSDEAFSVG